MTKILSKLFLCGILLSSINGYCSDIGLSIASGAGIPLDSKTRVEVNASTYTLNSELDAKYDIVVGAFIDDTFKYSDKEVQLNSTKYPAGSIIEATDFVLAKAATANDKTTWTETYGGMKIIPLQDAEGYYHISDDKTKIYKYATNGTYNDSDVLYNYSSDKWYTDNTQDTEANIRVIEIDGNKLHIDTDTNNILFSGNVAYKDGNTWKLLPGGSELQRALLDASSNKLIIIQILVIIYHQN